MAWTDGYFATKPKGGYIRKLVALNLSLKPLLDKQGKTGIILRATGYGLRATGYGLVLSPAFSNVNPTLDTVNFLDPNNFFSELPVWRFADFFVYIGKPFTFHCCGKIKTNMKGKMLKNEKKHIGQ